MQSRTSANGKGGGQAALRAVQAALAKVVVTEAECAWGPLSSRKSWGGSQLKRAADGAAGKAGSNGAGSGQGDETTFARIL